LAALFLAALAVSARAQTSPNAIQFAPIGSAPEGETVSIVATFNSAVTPVTALLFVRPVGQSSYLPLPLQVNGSQLQGQIPPSLVAAPGVEYFLSVTDEEDTTVTFPPTAPQSNPLLIAVAPRAAVFGLRPIAPSSGAVISEARPTLRFEHNGGGGGLDASTLRVFVDLREVSGSCRVDGGDILCGLPWDLALGTHTVTVAARSKQGAWAQPLTFTFSRSLEARRAPAPAGFHGRALLEGDWYRLLRKPDSTTFLPYPVDGNRVYPYLEFDADGKLQDEAVRVRIVQTSLDRLDQPGPGNYSLAFKGKDHELELGDSYKAWSDLSLSANRVRGARARGIGSFFTVEGLAALTRRAIENREFNTATYAQYVYGGRLSVVPVNRLTISAYGVEVRDDPGSVSTITLAIPVANRLAGSDVVLALPAGVTLTGELAFNRYVPNQRAENVSHGRGWEGKIAQNRPAFNWTVTYRNTTPGFVSLGNYLVQSDYRGVDGNGMLRLLQNRFILSGTGQVYRDNTEGRKTSTFRLRRYQLNASAQPHLKGPQVQLGVGQQFQRTDFATSQPFQNKMLNWSVGLNQGLGQFRVGWQLNVTQNRTVVGTTFARDFDTRYHSANASWFGRYGSVQLNGGFNRSRDLSTGAKSRNLSGTARGTLRAGDWEAEAAYTDSRGKDTNNLTSSRQTNSNASVSWRHAPKRVVKLRVEEASYSDFIRPRQTYKEDRVTVSYGLDF
jgi:hypothetical protein